MAVTVRYFAAAKAALGMGEEAGAFEGWTVGGLLAERADAAPDTVTASTVLARCSFLVNGHATTDRALVLTDGDTLDVLPPFAGG